MDINKLSNYTNGQIDGTHAAENSKDTVNATSEKSENSDISDKVSLNKYAFRNNEKLYGKVELEKLNHNSLDRLKNMKAKIKEYENAKNTSAEAASETEIGELINDPDVWSEIAQKIID